MQRESRSTAVPTEGRRRSEGAEEAPALAELARRFAKFREERPRGSRIPEDLRAAVLRGLDQGVSYGDIQRACGVSWSQVAAWQEKHRPGRRPPEADEAPGVRVFSVVDEPRVPRPVAPNAEAFRDLELRIGPWRVSLRLDDSGHTGAR